MLFHVEQSQAWDIGKCLSEVDIPHARLLIELVYMVCLAYVVQVLQANDNEYLHNTEATQVTAECHLIDIILSFHESYLRRERA
jgi:hypothetical protein